jgi:hypothetical protein
VVGALALEALLVLMDKILFLTLQLLAHLQEELLLRAVVAVDLGSQA